MTKVCDFLTICRACNSEKTNILNLFSVDCENEPTLGEKFVCCTSIMIAQNDEMPQNICYPCAKLLEEAYKFNKMCHNTNIDLQKHLSNSKSAVDVVEEPEPEEDSFCEVETLDSVFLEESLEDEENHVDLLQNNVKHEIFSDIDILEETPAEQDNYNLPKQQTTDTSDRQFFCNECDKKFFTVKALDLHHKIHHKRVVKMKVQPSNPLQNSTNLDECTYCDLVFANREEYKDHLLHYHSSGMDDNTCNICGKRLRNKIAFKNHLKVHETQNRPYVCNVCGKEYTEYRYMYRHMIYHKSNIFRCSQKDCLRTYSVKHKLVDHLRRHHQIYLTNIDVRKIQPTKLGKDDNLFRDEPADDY